LRHPVGGCEKPFAIGVDSGVVVWDRGGNAIGLLFSGHMQQPQQVDPGYTFVTPLEDVVLEHPPMMTATAQKIP